MTTQEIADTIGTLLRDFTRAGSIPKSEGRKRIEALIAKAVSRRDDEWREGIEGLKKTEAEWEIALNIAIKNKGYNAALNAAKSLFI
jgi:hypothetical protein